MSLATKLIPPKTTNINTQPMYLKMFSNDFSDIIARYIRNLSVNVYIVLLLLKFILTICDQQRNVYLFRVNRSWAKDKSD